MPDSPTPLDYATPASRRWTARPLVLVTLNVALAVSSLLLTPLASYLWSTTGSDRWAQVQAILYAVPLAILIFVLGWVTLALEVDIAYPRPSGARTTALLGPLTIPIVMLLWLIAGVAK